ncbi:hypothetical protein VIGAN_02003200 [Vigna angularis var. angularis]|uniref:Uncharacterized protein n=1 Tax=Vigna angularis var. angularis TaxID=157739 RepID=A0A0S3RAB8_PHAAN|nr:hypothetical protein VIGAN_02003200 [Vigna angularis var. angularis]
MVVSPNRRWRSSTCPNSTGCSRSTYPEWRRAPAMVEGRLRGSIACTGSVGGSRGGPIATDYIMSKHAVLGLLRLTQWVGNAVDL